MIELADDNILLTILCLYGRVLKCVIATLVQKKSSSVVVLFRTSREGENQGCFAVLASHKMIVYVGRQSV